MKTKRASAILVLAFVVGLELTGMMAGSAHAGPVPAPWTNTDVGGPKRPGSASYDALEQRFTVNGGGDDIWYTWDRFHYAYQLRSGDFTITARVISVENTDGWAKAGVMVRGTLDGNSKHAMVVVTPENGVAFQRRLETGGVSFHTAGAAVTAPYWVQLVRKGDTFKAYHSPDGSSWTQQGTAQTISMTDPVYIGLAVCSHDSGRLCTAVFNGVSISGSGPPNRPPSIISSPVTTATEDRRYTYDVEATDPDGDPLTYSLSTRPGGMTIDMVAGLIQWTPSEAQVGSHQVRVRVSDRRGGSDTQSFTINVAVTVNRPGEEIDLEITGIWLEFGNIHFEIAVQGGLSVETMEVEEGLVETGGELVEVSGTLTVRATDDYTLDVGATFKASGADLLEGADMDVAEGTVTVADSGEVVNMEVSGGDADVICGGTGAV